MCVSLKSSNAATFSLLSCASCSISYACFSMVSSALRAIWYYSGKCSVTYSLMDSLARLRKYSISSATAVFVTCSSELSLRSLGLLFSAQLLYLFAILVVRLWCSLFDIFLHRYNVVRIFSFI
jgi:hypothetical protein